MSLKVYMMMVLLVLIKPIDFPMMQNFRLTPNDGVG